MRDGQRVATVIPALNEEAAIGKVLAAIPAWVDQVIVVDNGSQDRTAARAQACGAKVVRESRRGYGAACLAGIAALDAADIVVFLDADFSDFPEDMGLLVDPLIAAEADLVIGSRVQRQEARRVLTPQQRFGNSLACLLMRLFWRAPYSDLGPFRAIRREALSRLAMRDRDYGWTVEMQIKALRRGLKVHEVPVRYRQRIGVSKISGTLRGTLGAGFKICWIIFSHMLRQGDRGMASF